MNKIVRLFILKSYPFLKSARQFLGQRGQGIKVIIRHDDKILLIENTYCVGWTLPGGGVKKNEALLQAAIREVKEEVGIKLTTLKKLGTVKLDFERNNLVTVFVGEINLPECQIDGLEVERAKWVKLTELVESDLLPIASRGIQLFKSKF